MLVEIPGDDTIGEPAAFASRYAEKGVWHPPMNWVVESVPPALHPCLHVGFFGSPLPFDRLHSLGVVDTRSDPAS